VNNPGHFSFFKGNVSKDAGVVLIAGPWLYVFNQWALSFAAANGAGFFVSPLENNRQNLERTASQETRNRFFITVYSRPSLFRIRANLGKVYSFKKFAGNKGAGNRDEDFTLLSGPDGSLVYPERPFYIADKIPFLQQAGFSRFILDFSAAPLKKNDYKDLMEKINEAVPLRGAGRFNWKDGFYKVEE
jgi:putative protease